jgi:hypothetical protein
MLTTKELVLSAGTAAAVLCVVADEVAEVVVDGVDGVDVDDDVDDEQPAAARTTTSDPAAAQLSRRKRRPASLLLLDLMYTPLAFMRANKPPPDNMQCMRLVGRNVDGLR